MDILTTAADELALVAQHTSHVQVTSDDRTEFGRALVLQGFEPDRAIRIAAELESNDGALQMLARHRLRYSGEGDQANSATPDGIAALREAAGYNPLGFVAEARCHAKDMPCCIQRDYLNRALDKIERFNAALSALNAGEGEGA